MDVAVIVVPVGDLKAFLTVSSPDFSLFVTETLLVLPFVIVNFTSAASLKPSAVLISFSVYVPVGNAATVNLPSAERLNTVLLPAVSESPAYV